MSQDGPSAVAVEPATVARTVSAREDSAKLYAALVLMVTLWSANFLVAKVVMKEFSALSAAGLRLAIAGAIILPVFLIRRGWRALVPENNPKSALKLLGLGLLGVGVNQTFFLLGIEHTSIAHAALVIALTPALVLAIAAMMEQERVTPRKVAGLALASSGIAALQLESGKAGDSSLLGDFFIFCASLTFALFTVIGKRATRKFDGLTVNTFAYAGSGAAMLPATLWMAAAAPLGEVSTKAWLGLVYMAAVPSLICYSIFYYALTRVPATRVSALAYLQPLIATSLAVVFFGDRLTVSLLSGGALILAGVYLAERA
jgi:drug/metabolite transporter (DMT)-like permease